MSLRIEAIRHELARSKFRKYLAWLRHRGLSEKDVFLASYPRSGNTWLRFILYELFTEDTAEFASAFRGIPEPGRRGPALKLLPNAGRIFKTHELPRSEYHRTIYIIRDVRDVVRSEQLFNLRMGYSDMNFQEFLGPFLAGMVNPFGSWKEHVSAWLSVARESSDQVLVLRFEDMRSDISSALDQVFEFLGVHPTPVTVEKAIDSNTLEQMRRKEDRTPPNVIRAPRPEIRWINKGEIGGWRDWMDPTQLRMIESECGELLLELGYQLGFTDIAAHEEGEAE